MPTTDTPAWLITGCSSGFGRALAEYALERGMRVAVTARDPRQAEDITASYGERALALRLDVTDADQVVQAVARAQAQFGGIDVLVNNAGFGYLASVEESEEERIRAMFETNFFGLSRMTQAVLPGMRERKRGCIVNISSVGGLVGVPALGYYNATKFAVEGLSEALAKEVAPLGIKVLIVEPGPFRTDWAGRSIQQSATKIPDYAATAGARSDMIQGYSGRQPGDPARAAAAIFEAVQSQNTPLRLVLGKAALDMARGKLEELRRNFDQWEKASLSADFPETRAA
jgi:NAD(P)-dependent dehydrogenase (short-subunit alcohol dehydrogenase family)